MTFFLVSNTTAATYYLTAEWYENESNKHLKSMIKILKENKPLKRPLALEAMTGFNISEFKVHKVIGADKYNKIGEVTRCEGLLDKCLDIKGILKFRIPSNYENPLITSWQWDETYFEIVSRKKYQQLGQNLDILEILSYCESCKFKVGRIDFDTVRGIINIKLQSENMWLNYTLREQHGFLGQPN
jgi:hypothetical protein